MNRKIPVAFVGASVLLLGAVYVQSCNRIHARDEKSWAFAVSPQENCIVFTGNGQGGQDLFLLNLKSWKVTHLTNTPHYESSPAFSPDGKSVVYAAGNNERADHIFTRWLGEKSARQLTDEDCNDRAPTFSPDGKRIVFVRDSEYLSGGMVTWGTWRNSQLYAVETDGNRLQRLTKEDFYSIDAPSFSPNGREIVFSFGHGEYGASIDIGEVQYDTHRELKSVKQLTSNGTAETGKTSWIPTFSLDNRHILFFSYEDENCCQRNEALFMADRNGQGARPIAKKLNVLNPVFSTNQKHVYFILYPQYSLWRMDNDGSNRIKIADSTLFKKPVTWKPKNLPRL